jgi:hypothetical protein
MRVPGISGWYGLSIVVDVRKAAGSTSTVYPGPVSGGSVTARGAELAAGAGCGGAAQEISGTVAVRAVITRIVVLGNDIGGVLSEGDSISRTMP